MCVHAILRVRFDDSKEIQKIEVTSEAELRSRIEDIQSKDKPAAIEVFMHKHDIVLSREWKTQLYQEAE